MTHKIIFAHWGLHTCRDCFELSLLWPTLLWDISIWVAKARGVLTWASFNPQKFPPLGCTHCSGTNNTFYCRQEQWTCQLELMSDTAYPGRLFPGLQCLPAGQLLRQGAPTQEACLQLKFLVGSLNQNGTSFCFSNRDRGKCYSLVKSSH